MNHTEDAGIVCGLVTIPYYDRTVPTVNAVDHTNTSCIISLAS
jgi:hypothetical protein